MRSSGMHESAMEEESWRIGRPTSRRRSAG
jgi:hypothetical protein